MPKVTRGRIVSNGVTNSPSPSGTPKFSKEFAQQVLTERCTTIRTTPEGSRHQALIRHAAYIGKIIGLGSLDEKSSINSLLEAAIASGLSHFESVNTINTGINYGKNLID